MRSIGLIALAWFCALQSTRTEVIIAKQLHWHCNECSGSNEYTLLSVILDIPFLIKSHAKVVETDEFTKKLVDILIAVQKEGIRQKITLLTQRSDYMCHVEGDKELQLKQIEVNNIAVSMGGLAQRASLLHRRIMHKCGGYDHKPLRPIFQPTIPLRL
uniref:Glutathione synthetase n=1 Tax=Ditylenchus dipsaci TaxID=166011 RepID=A0A915EAS3_9BILA